MLIATVLAAFLQSTAPPTPVAVFVHTEVAPDATKRDRATTDRLASVADLRAALAEKKKDVALVDDPEPYDVDVEVLERTVTVPKVVVGMSGPIGSVGSRVSTTPNRTVHLRVRLVHGSDEVELTNKNAPFETAGGWKAAADDIAKQIDKWVVEHVVKR